MKLIFKLLIAHLVISGIIYAQENNGLVLLKLDVDARSAAMAGMNTSIAGNASGSHYNPALLAAVESPSMVAMYNDQIFDISHSYAAIQFIQGEHNFSISFNYLQMPGIAIRGNVPTEDPSGIVEAFNLAAGLSYATNFNEWQIGGTLNYIFEKYYLSTAPGFAVDFGILKKSAFEGIDFGLAIKNMGKMSSLKNEPTPLPLTIQTGFTYYVPNFFDDKLILTPGVRWISKEQVYFGMGAEYQLVDYLAVRGGLKNGLEELLWSFGVGINYNTFHFDYAYSSLEFDLGNPVSMFSIGITY